LAKVKRGDIAYWEGPSYRADIPYHALVEVKAMGDAGRVFIAYKGEIFEVSESGITEALNDD
jgi:hypothetical protein